MAEFVHCHLHTDYAVVDGLIRVKKLFPAVKALGMTACAVTDVMNLFAAIKVYKAANAEGIKPIFGVDVWVHDPEFDQHLSMTLLCLNNEGYQNITNLISKAYLDGERVSDTPLVDKAWMTPESCKGLAALSGAMDGDVGRYLLRDNPEAAKAAAEQWVGVFGQDNVYLELSRLGLENEALYIERAVQLAYECDLPVIATQNVRFLKQQDFDAHEIRYCIRQGATLDDTRRDKPFTKYQYLTSPDEMATLFDDIPEAIENAVELSKRCNVTFDLNKPQLPDFPVPEGMTIDSFLREQSKIGLDERLVDVLLEKPPEEHEAIKKEYDDRLNIELDVIISMGFPGYFMIVADFIQWAKDNGIPVGPGRGSGAGSLVAYALKITDLDPLPYDLLFERFLNPERISMPDFDIDFCMDGRDRVIEYVMHKYGVDAVSQIITFGTMAAKAVIRDVGRVLGHPYGFVDGVAKLVPFDIGITLTKALEEDEAFKERYDSDDEVKSLIDMCLKLEGLVRNVGKHAGGVVISPTVLTDFSAVYCETGSRALVSQFDKDDVEAAGLVKFDFLGLRNLTIIDAAIKNITLTHPDIKIDINKIPLDDPDTFKLLKRCETTAVFQLESRGMKDLVRRLQPDTFEDIVALVALFRPGPLQSGMVDDFINRKHGRQSIEYPHPDTANILAPTYGIILYQEQVMMIPQILSGYTLGGADILRRAMGKKKPEEMAKQREVFVGGALKNNIEEATATYIFDLIEKFSGYGFNKSHSAAYALVAYQTAYLKAHYPAEFMAAVLSSDMDNTEKMVNFIEDSKQIGITVMRPDINQSFYRFTVKDEKIIYGLGAIKGAGEAAIENIVEERTLNGPFKDLFDFTKRVDAKKVNKRAIEALVLAGALDELGPDRETVLMTIPSAVKYAEKHFKDDLVGQNDFFASEEDTAPEFVVARDVNKIERYIKERQVLGLFLSGHPIDEYKPQITQLGINPLFSIKPGGKKDKPQKIAGLIVGSRRIKTKRGSIMQILTIDDTTARQEVTIFSDVLETYRELITPDACLVIEAQVTHDEYSGNMRVVARQLMTLEEARMRYVRNLTLDIRLQPDMSVMQELKAIVDQHAGGRCPVSILYQNNQAEARFEFGEAHRISVTDDCLEALKRLLNERSVKLTF